jgi:hypothetical protein
MSLKFKNNHWPFYMRFQKVSLAVLPFTAEILHELGS